MLLGGALKWQRAADNKPHIITTSRTTRRTICSHRRFVIAQQNLNVPLASAAPPAPELYVAPIRASFQPPSAVWQPQRVSQPPFQFRPFAFPALPRRVFSLAVQFFFGLHLRLTERKKGLVIDPLSRPSLAYPLFSLLLFALPLHFGKSLDLRSLVFLVLLASII